MRAGLSAAAFAMLVVPAAQAQTSSPVTLEGADRDTLAAIAATLPERDRPETGFDAERLSEEAADRAADWLRSEGYYAGIVEPKPADAPPRAHVVVRLGPRFTFAAPALLFSGGAPDAQTEAAVRKALAIVAPGAPARAPDVLAAETAAVLVLRDRGFAEAKASPRTAIVDHATTRMSVGFVFDIGAPVTLGHVRVEPAGVVKPDFVDALKSWKPGARYEPDKLVALRRDLTSTGAFTRAQVSLAPASAAGGARDVIVHLDPAKPHSIALGASYSTTEGAGVDTEWTRHNIYGRADSLTLSASLADQDQKLGADLFRPHAAGRGRGRRYGVVVEHETLAPYERTGVTVSTDVESDAYVKFARSYGVSIAANAYAHSAGVSNALILSGFVDVSDDRSDRKLDPRKGSILQARLEPSVSFGEASTAFVRATASARGYVSPGKTGPVTFAARAGIGWVEPLLGAETDLPIDKLFYAGGGGSVRGYQYRSIYPNTSVASSAPPGGQGLLETSFEARLHATDTIGGAVFVDGGAAFNDVSGAGEMRWGAGVGLRYNLGFAPLRLDIATPLDKRPGDPTVSFYVSLGQAF